MSHPATSPTTTSSGGKDPSEPASWMSATSTRLAGNLSGLAKRLDGSLVLWIGQGENPGQVENARLVKEAEAAGLEGQLGIEEALAGACYAIVLELFRDVITRKTDAPSTNYLAEMQFIPDRYREIQRSYTHKLNSYLLAARIAIRNGALVTKYQQLLRTVPHAAPAIRAFWKSELDRCTDSLDKNFVTVGALGPQLNVTPELLKAGIGSKLVRPNGPVNAEIVLKSALTEDGCTMVGLQGATTGHAVGFVVTTRFFRDDTFLFIDPNTGIFRFNRAERFREFIKTYWEVVLENKYPRGTISRYK